jgi:hypothetical protein
MFRQWFDKRAEEGQHYTLAIFVERSYDINTWRHDKRTRYEVVQVIHADRDCISKYGWMTQKEAIAMAKLLNATSGECK